MSEDPLVSWLDYMGTKHGFTAQVPEVPAEEAPDQVCSAEPPPDGVDPYAGASAGEYPGAQPVPSGAGKDEAAKEFFDRVGAVTDLAGTGAGFAELVGSGWKDIAGPVKALGLTADFAKGVADGQGAGETAAEVAGKALAGEVTPLLGLGSPSEGLTKAGAVDLAINTINSAAKAMGAGEEVTDYTGLAADLTASKMVENMASQAARAAYNYAFGDEEDLARQKEEILTGDAGAPLQGYGQAKEIYDRLEAGENPVEVFDEVGKKSEGTAVARLYDDLAESVGNSGERIEEGEYKATSGFELLDYVIEEGLDLDSAL